MSKHILITGATGFLGLQVIKSLENEDVKLKIIARKPDIIKHLKLTVEHEIVPTNDLFEESEHWWKTQCENIDAVVHLAWYVEPKDYLISEKNIQCLRGSIDLAKGAASAGVKSFLGVGTCFEYDLSHGTLDVNTPLRPLTAYAAAKVALFSVLSNWLPSQNVDFTWCRLFYLYGEGEHHSRLFPNLHTKLKNGEIVHLTKGLQTRDFLNVKEAGDVISELLINGKTGPINVCSGIPITVRQFAERIADEYGRQDLLSFGTRQENIFDPKYVLGIPNFSNTGDGE